ncbi:PadR family transcriptional regulator [Paenibacillus tengchongensis]|uniref:PadR family transcriptional regulator n=1 Tax=Paenibacillus tengchongensis TaxID=2608684 RepID=UPI00124CC397|nr:PadR family transcriptional regulator [Paenibacillus tengchongensis]
MKVSKELLKGSTGTLILTLLQEKPLYGYELIKLLEQRSGGIFSLKEGTLYPILHAMETERWVEAYWQEVDGRRRKYYRIQDEGRLKLQEKKSEWLLFRGAVDAVLGEG